MDQIATTVRQQQQQQSQLVGANNLTIEEECVLRERLKEIPEWVGFLPNGVMKRYNVGLKGQMGVEQVGHKLDNKERQD